MKFRALLVAVLTVCALANTVQAQYYIPDEDITTRKARLKSSVIRPVVGKANTYEVVLVSVDGSKEVCVLDGTVDIVIQQDSSIRGTWARAYLNVQRPFCLIAVRTKAAQVAWEAALEKFGLPGDVIPKYSAQSASPRNSH